MDNQLLITWIIIIVVALGLDIGGYFFLRRYWEKNDVVLTDVWLNKIMDPIDLAFDWVDQLGLRLRALFFLKSETKQTPVLVGPAAVAEILPSPEPELEAASEVEEIIPVSVEQVDGVRRVRFSLEMPLNTTVDVRIGATQESGVTVEKRELS
jgi:hypothetical protein